MPAAGDCKLMQNDHESLNPTTGLAGRHMDMCHVLLLLLHQPTTGLGDIGSWNSSYGST
jgi:hypothetical protein